jgi:hypothetical protein
VLLAFEESRNGLDRHDLRVFPLLARQAATIELALELPFTAGTSLELDPRNQTIGMLDVRVAGRAVRALHAWQRVELVAVAPSPSAPALPVSTVGRALFGTAPPLVPRVVLPTLEAVSCTFGGSLPIRRVVKLHLPALGHCYERVAQWRPGIEGDVVAHFRIEPNGRVSSVAVTGTLTDPRVTSCLEGVFAGMAFPPDSSAAEVNYPIKFRMAE